MGRIGLFLPEMVAVVFVVGHILSRFNLKLAKDDPLAILQRHYDREKKNHLPDTVKKKYRELLCDEFAEGERICLAQKALAEVQLDELVTSKFSHEFHQTSDEIEKTVGTDLDSLLVALSSDPLSGSLDPILGFLNKNRDMLALDPNFTDGTLPTDLSCALSLELSKRLSHLKTPEARLQCVDQFIGTTTALKELI